MHRTAMHANLDPGNPQYYGDDEGTRAIVLYVEGLRDPLKFLNVAGEVTRNKPILAMKAGRTKDGAKAAASHNGGLRSSNHDGPHLRRPAISLQRRGRASRRRPVSRPSRSPGATGWASSPTRAVPR